MDGYPGLEEQTQSIGRALHTSMSGVPPVFDARGWMGRIMDRAMKSEDFKTALFRFIDVLPSLASDELVVRLAREYFSGDGPVPTFVQRGLGIIPERGILARAAAPVIRTAVSSIARQFIAAADDRTLLRALDALAADGSGFTIDLLGEVVVSEKEARACARSYLSLLDLLNRPFAGLPGPDVSLKISSFYSQLDPVNWQGSIERTKQALRPVLRKAKEYGISLTFDMEHYHFKGLIIAIFKSILEEEEFRELPRAGIALQAYLEDTGQDLPALIDWARRLNRRILVRLVKGAYWDYEVAVSRQQGWPTPVFLDKEETDKSFEALTRLLFENIDILRPAVATHNLRSIAHAIACAKARSARNGDFEFQMLYGMAEPLRKAVRKEGYGLRVYTPVGALIPGMAYLVRRLLENTSNVSFLRRSFSLHTSFEELLKPPGAAPRSREDTGASADVFRNEPLLDFSIEKNRKDMTQALAEVRSQAGAVCPLLIGGRTVRTGNEIVSRNPAEPDHIVGRVSSASKEHCDDAIREALKARDGWRRTAPVKRAGFLFRAAAELRRRRAELAALEVFEVGKTWKDADGDVAEAIDYLEYYGREMIRLGSPRALGDYPGEKNEYRYLPKGIGAVIAPWNFPLAIATGMVSAGLVTGNCVLFKPSGQSVVTACRLCDTFRTVGLPPGVLQFLPGPGNEVGEYLVSHPAVDFIAFTGSKDVGLRIVRLAAETAPGQRSVKKVIAEMGGKNAVIVDETADLDEAVKGIIESAFGYQGQKCSACSRVIAVEGVCDELCRRLAEAADSLHIGPTEDPANSMGPVIDGPAREKIESYIETGRQEAATLFEKKASGAGFFLGPVIFTNAAPESRIATEEIFGPVLTVFRAKDIEDAIRLANHSRYALTGGIFSRSPANIRKAKEEFLTGNLYVNRKITGALVGRQPFGGFAMSGVGSKAGGPDYLFQFMNPAAITENTIRRGFAPLESNPGENE